MGWRAWVQRGQEGRLSLAFCIFLPLEVLGVPAGTELHVQRGSGEGRMPAVRPLTPAALASAGTHTTSQYVLHYFTTEGLPFQVTRQCFRIFLTTYGSSDELNFFLHFRTHLMFK